MYGQRTPAPSFLAAALAAGVAGLLAWMAVIALSVPLFLTLATGSALSWAPDGRAALGAVSVVVLLFAVVEPLIAAGIAKALVAGFSGATVGYLRAVGAMFASLLATVVAAEVLPPAAGMGVVAYGMGAIAAGWLLSRPRRIS
jgi:hypothetical protein